MTRITDPTLIVVTFNVESYIWGAVKIQTKETIMNNAVESEVKKSNWALDPTHSKIQFSARHMVITQVTGHFNKYDLNVNASDDFLDADVELTVDINSIDTGNIDRDNHLKSADFFDAEKYPKMVFKSGEVEKVGDTEYKLKGDLTIKGVTKPIELGVEFGGKIKDPWGKERAGFTVTGKVNRFDYGLQWNALMETGGAVVGKDIKITCDVEVVKND